MKETFLEKTNEYFIAILGVVMMFCFICLWNIGKIPFEDCVFLCIFFGVGSIINTILVTGERIINKINELNKENKEK